jgi:hypothetical protein
MYFNAVYPSTSNSGVLTAGLHAVEAFGYERGCADERRRVLDALERWAAPRYWDNDEDKANLEEWIQWMRREWEQ